MSTLISLPPTRQPLLSVMQSRKQAVLRISDFPALALAATATTGELDTRGEAFAAVSACLETLQRLKLSGSSAWLLILLVKHGPQSCSQLVSLTKTSSAAITGLITLLEALGLVALDRVAADRRVVIVTATSAARKVLASLCGLTALGSAASVLNRIPNRR